MTKIKKPVKPTPVSKPEGPGPRKYDSSVDDNISDTMVSFFIFMTVLMVSLVTIMGFVQ